MRCFLVFAALVLAQPAGASPFGPLFAGERPAHVGRGELAPCPPTPNCVSSRASDAVHAVAPIPTGGDPAVAMRRLALAAGALPGARVVVSGPDYLHVEVASRFMGFVDDLEAVPGASGAIDLRSASRVGRSDFGVNRARVEVLREALGKP